MAAHVGCPERVLGAHFFSPAHVMQLFEIVRTPSTSAQAIVDTLGLSKQIKKMPVVVGNCTGFAVNRVFYPYTMAACLLVDLGLDPYRIDAVIKEKFGMPMGPFRLSDLVGGDVGVHVGKNIMESFPDRVYPATLIPSLVAAKRLGEKTGAGFYKFDAKRKAHADPEGLAPFLAASRAKNSMRKPSSMSDEDIIEFIFFPVVNEGARVIAEGIVSKASDLDVASVLGMGFPPFRGGLIKWADTVGAPRIAARLTEWAKLYGPLFTPAPYLAQAATQRTPLAAGHRAHHRRAPLLAAGGRCSRRPALSARLPRLPVHRCRVARAAACGPVGSARAGRGRTSAQPARSAQADAGLAGPHGGCPR